MDVLITGGAGFIGARTATMLAQSGHRVTMLDTLSEQIHGADPAASPTYRMAQDAGEVVRGDVRDRPLMADLLARHDAVLHLAAETGTGQSMYDIARYNDVNVMGTAILLDLVTAHPGRISRMVVASSRSVYGEGSYTCAVHGRVHPTERPVAALEAGRFDPTCPLCDAPIAIAATREDATLSPASVYAVTKLAQENLMLAVGRAREVGTVALRYQNVYGPGQSLSNPYTGILSIFSREMLNARPIEIFEDGAESRDFVHVTDVARANVLALTAQISGAHVLNIGTGVGTGVLDLAHDLGSLLDYAGEISISGRFRAGDIRHNVADIGAAARVLGWRPAIDFATGLDEFAAWVPTVIAGVDEGAGYGASLKELERMGMIGGIAPTSPDA